MDVDEAITGFLNHRKLRGVSPSTLSAYEKQIRFWQQWCLEHYESTSLEAIQIKHFRDFLLYLKEEHVPHGQNRNRRAADKKGMSPATIESFYKTLRSFWVYLEGEDLLSFEQTRFFTNGRIPRPRVPEPIRPVYTPETIDALLRACERIRGDEGRTRNRAIVLLLFETGMRASELCSIQDDDTNLKRRRARIVGKGGRERFVFWGPRTAQALTEYLKYRRGESGGPLLRAMGSRSTEIALTRDAVKLIFQRLAEHAGVELLESAPVHGMRHTFAHQMIDKGADISRVGQFLGHSKIETTMRYLRENADRLGDIYDELNGYNENE
jgi:integrase/recombinase XerD